MDCAGKDVVLGIHKETPGKLKFFWPWIPAAALGSDPLANMQGVALKGLHQLSMVHPRRNRLEAQAELNNWSQSLAQAS